MKRLLHSVACACLLTPLNEASARFTAPVPTEIGEPPRAVAEPKRLDYALYLGKNARWLVDLRLNIVSAWALERDVPLWSRDGVVFRAKDRPNDVVADFATASKRPTAPAIEIFGRVYFFLNDALVALDPNAQGRLVWRRNAQDFARFFAATPPLRDANSNADNAKPSLIPEIRSLSGDRLLIEARFRQETLSFILDAASGDFRLARPDETQTLQAPSSR